MTGKLEAIEDGIIKCATRSGEVRYRVRLKDRRGQWYPRQTFKRLADARNHKAKLLGERERGALAGSVEARRVTLADFWERWKVECRARVSDGWKGDQERMWAEHLAPTLGSMRISEIRSQDVGRALEAVRARGLGPQSVLHVYNLLHKIFEDAIEHFEIVDRNPVLRRYRPSVPKTQRSFLRPEQAAQLLEFTREHPLGPAIWLGLLCGLRPSEVQALTWDAVSYDPPQIQIKAAYKRKVRRIEPYPKGKDWGLVPMPPPLTEFLKARGVGKKPLDWVAPNPNGRMLYYESYSQDLKRLCRQAGVPEVTPHELRHSCTELWVRFGASREDISRVLNQKSSQVVDRYMHRTDDRTAAIASNIRLPAVSINNKKHAPTRPRLALVR